MKSSILAFLSAAVALVGLTLSTSSAAATQTEEYAKALGKRVITEEFKSGICVCTGGSTDGFAGMTAAIADEDGTGQFYVTACLAVHLRRDDRRDQRHRSLR